MHPNEILLESFCGALHCIALRERERESISSPEKCKTFCPFYFSPHLSQEQIIVGAWRLSG